MDDLEAKKRAIIKRYPNAVTWVDEKSPQQIHAIWLRITNQGRK